MAQPNSSLGGRCSVRRSAEYSPLAPSDVIGGLLACGAAFIS